MTVTDVTEKKRLQGQLMLADRMASVGVLAAGVAHEINNPLTYVLANLQLIERHLGAGLGDLELERLGALLEDAHIGAERVRAIVRDLGTFAHSDDELRATDLGEVLESSLRIVDHEIRPRALPPRNGKWMKSLGSNLSTLSRNRKAIRGNENRGHGCAKQSVQSTKVLCRIATGTQLLTK